MCLLFGKASEKSLDILENVLMLAVPSILHCGCKDQVLRQFQVWKYLLKPWSCFVESMASMVPLDHVGYVSWFSRLKHFSAVAGKTGLTAVQLRAHGLNSKFSYELLSSC